MNKREFQKGEMLEMKMFLERQGMFQEEQGRKMLKAK